MFKKVLIANRGEIALRVIRACHELDIKTVAVYSTVDELSLHVKFADEAVCIGPPQSKDSYLNIPRIIAAGEITGADAIHPGYGFLSESAQFSKICKENGFAFLGPSPEIIDSMGNKAKAKQTMKLAGVPVVPGGDGILDGPEDALDKANAMGYPVMLKASAGGGGRGMRLVKDSKDVIAAYKSASQESLTAFGNGDIYIEKFIENPRHIEVQIIGDSFGNIIHVGERECSIQRRSQKIIEECPSPAISEEEREKICDLTIEAFKKVGYKSLGTVEYLYSNGEFYFIEMNTRLQVEHTITEEVYNLDIVKEQIFIASGEKISINQNDVKKMCHSIECRINAENPITLLPSTGMVTTYHPPGGPGIRVDSLLYSGCSVTAFYDGLVSKIIVKGNTRNECIMRLNRALDEYVIEGIETNISSLKKIINHENFIGCDFDISWFDKQIENN